MALSYPQDVNIPLEKRKILRRLLLKKGVTLEDDELDELVIRFDLLIYARAYADAYEEFNQNTDEEVNDEKN